MSDSAGRQDSEMSDQGAVTELRRTNWGTRAGFILAAAGSAVGVGNLWKFPYITWENNGGAFVLIYLLCVPLIGLPIMVAELLLGRRAQANAVSTMERMGAPAAGGRQWKIVGWLGVAGSATILSYIIIIAGWAVASFFQCMSWSVNGYTEQPSDAFARFMANTGLQIFLSFVFLVATVIIVIRGISGGIEKANKILMPALFGFILVLVIYTLTLEGFGQAMGFLFAPRFGALSDQAILEAMGQSFFSLSLGMAIMITYGSYLGPKESITKSAALIVSMDTLVAIMACVILYPIIFSFPEIKSSISGSTTGMLFITLPPLFYTKLSGGALLGPLFYLLVIFAALSSSISLLEVVVALLIDRFSYKRVKATLVSAGVLFIGTVLAAFSLNPDSFLAHFQVFGSSESGFFYDMNHLFFRGKTGIFNIADHLVANWLLPVTGLCITLFVGWFLDKKIILEELGLSSGSLYFQVFRVIMRFIAPLAIFYVLYSVIAGTADFT